MSDSQTQPVATHHGGASSDSQTQPDTAHHEQALPPVRTTLTTSSPDLALSGDPPFIVKTTHECTSDRPIWALIRVFADFATGIRIRDIEPLLDSSGEVIRYHRRMGPDPTIVGDRDDDGNMDLDDTELVRLALGEHFSTEYTISTVRKLNGLVRPDTRLMKAGGRYEIYLRDRRWRWMFEDEMGGDLSKEERREILSKMEVEEWAADNRVTFGAM
ncbi:hypothetical protein EJ08DRAFT_653679, partial [Tothia fuscella]